MHVAIKDGFDWIGYIDWTVRDFHGYHTFRGSTYNAYLIRDEKTALIDTVKAPYVSPLLENISGLVDPEKIDYVICNHAEPDHSGGLMKVLRTCINAELVCDAKCKNVLSTYYDTTDWNFRVVADGTSLSLGSRTLTFIETPMVHWPESMCTYAPEDKILFSMDAFGQHYASSARFDDEAPLDLVMSEAKTYYANIVMPYGKPIARVLERVSKLPVEIIAPSHGVIWRSHIKDIIAAYKGWTVCKPAAKVLVVYDTMWKSTERMAHAIVEGASQPGVDVKLINIRTGNITEIATETLDAAAIAFGSPTLNQTLMPQMAAALTYLKGLKPTGKSGFAFGSYGWAKNGAQHVEEYVKAIKFEVLHEPIQSQYAPSDEVLEECRKAGKMLAETALKKAK